MDGLSSKSRLSQPEANSSGEPDNGKVSDNKHVILQGVIILMNNGELDVLDNVS